MVRFGGAVSSGISALTGVSQGFSPGSNTIPLFIIDICECTQAKFLLFADDVKLSVKYPPHEWDPHQLLQSSLDGVKTWCSRNEMELIIIIDLCSYDFQ